MRQIYQSLFIPSQAERCLDCFYSLSKIYTYAYITYANVIYSWKGFCENVPPPQNKKRKKLSYMVSTTHVQFHTNIEQATPLKSNILFLGWLCHSSFPRTVKTGPSISASSLAFSIITFYSSHSDGHIVICHQDFNLSSLNGTEKWTIFPGVYSLLCSLLRKPWIVRVVGLLACFDSILIFES